MHQIARQMPELEARFTPYYCDGLLELLRRAGLVEFTILGASWRADCVSYLQQHRLPIDHAGAEGGYDLVVTCSDVIVPRNVRGNRIVLVQEGMTDPERFLYWLRRLLHLPLWASGTAGTGLSGCYERFCVASPGYRELFIRKGAPAERIVVTGIPNFDDCARYRHNDLGRRGYVLVCTSDTRETLKWDNRKAFIRRALEIAAGRPLVFKLHPNENRERNSREIRALAPHAEIFTSGCAEEMVANCDVLVVQYSTLAFVGLALDKEVHAYADLDDLRRLLPLQGGMAAVNIAEVCRQVLAARASDGPPQSRPRWRGARAQATPVAA